MKVLQVLRRLPRALREFAKPISGSTLLIIGIFVFALAVIAAVAIFAVVQDQRDFNSMTPTEHLQRAKGFLDAKLFDDGLKHIAAIPASAPEAVEATEIQHQLTTAKTAWKNDLDAKAEAKASDDKARTAYTRDLQDELRQLGYDLTVAQSDKPEEVVIASKDFEDTDHRVRFLAYIRGQNRRPGLCSRGFGQVRIESGGIIGGFNEVYSLDCWR